MSVLQGLAPTVHVTNNVGDALRPLLDSDNDCVRMLLNSYSDGEKNAEANAQDYVLNEKFNMMTSSNKSLLVTSTHNTLTSDEKKTVDNLKLNYDQSYLIYKEKFRYKLDVPDNGVLAVNDDVSLQNPSGMSLAENSTSEQNILNAQDAFRKNNKNNISSLLGPESLGLTDKIMKNDFSRVSAEGDVSSSLGFSMTFPKSDSDPSKYAYGTIRVSYGDAKVDVDNSLDVADDSLDRNGNVVLQNGNQISDISSQSLADYENGDSSGGNYSSSYNDLTSGNVEISISNPDGSDAAFGKRSIMNNSSTSQFVLQPDFQRVNLSQLGQDYPRDNLVLSEFQYIQPFPKKDGLEVNNVLQRLNTNGQQEMVTDPTKWTTTTDITIDNRTVSTRMNGVNSFISENNVFYTNSELSSGFDSVLSSSDHNTDVNYNINLLEASTVTGGNAQYIVKNGPSDIGDVSPILLNGSQPARNLVFSISENQKVEIANDAENADGFLLNLDDSSKNLDLDENEVPADGGSQIVSGSRVSASYLRNGGFASSNTTNLRVLFANRLTEQLLKSTRDSSVSSGTVVGDALTKIAISASTSQSMSAGARAVFQVDSTKPVEWDPDASFNEAMQLYTLNPDALAYKLVYYPKFIQGGEALKKEIARSGVAGPDGVKVLLPFKVQADGASQALSRNSSNALVYTAIVPDQSMCDIDDATIELVTSSLGAADASGNQIRSVTAKISHSPLIPTLKNALVSYTLTYRYYESGPLAWRWTSTSASAGYGKGVWPQPSVTLEINPAFVFPHSASLQGEDETSGSQNWRDLPGQSVRNVNFSLNYDSENPLRFNDSSNSFDVSLRLYSNYKTVNSSGMVDAPSFYNNNYSLELKATPGLWSAKYRELNDANMKVMNHSNILDLLSTGTVDLSVDASRSTRNTSQTTLTVKDGSQELFKCLIDNNRLRDMVGYRMSDTWVEAIRVESGNSLFKGLVSDNTVKKLEDGVYIKLASISSSRSSPIASLSLKNDLFQSSWPSISQREVPNDRVLMNYESRPYMWNGGNSYGYYKTIMALQRRAMPNGVYVFERPKNKYVAKWGDLEESGDMGNDSAMYPQYSGSVPFRKFTLNFGKSADIKVAAMDAYFLNVSMSDNPTDLIQYRFVPNYSTVVVKMNGQEVGRHSTSRTSPLPFTLDEVAPFVHKYKLNNFFCDPQTITITLKQSDVLVEHDGDYLWASASAMKSGFSADSSLTITEDQFKNSNEQNGIVPSGKINFTLTYAPKLRRSAKTMYASILPEVLKLDLKDSVQNHIIQNRDSLDLQLGGSSSNTHVLSLASIDSSKLASVLHTYTVEKKNLLVTLQGSLNTNNVYDDDVSEEWASWNNYLDRAEFIKNGEFLHGCPQQGAGNDERDILKFIWNATSATRFKDVWSQELVVSPKTLSQVKQYVLGFRSDNGVLVPQVHRLTSALFNPNKLLDLSKVNGLSLMKILLASPGQAHVGDITGVNVPLPYNFSTAVDYPQASNVSVSVSLSQKPVNMTHLDLLVQVDSSDNASKVKYTNIFGAPTSGSDPFVNKAVSIFSKDQLVLVNHLGKLSMRVGPDGRLYTGDVSSYSYHCNAVNSVLGGTPANGIMSLPLNNNVALNNMVQQ